MTGYRLARSDIKNPVPDVLEKYQCPHCKLLLKDAVQPVCGHWLCKSCADELLESPSPKCPRPDCLEGLKADVDADEGAEYFADRFVRREIEGLIVSCSNRLKGCQWEDRLVKLDDHRNRCSFAILRCQDCGEVLPLDKMESHKLTCPKALMKCPLAKFECQHTQLMTREKLRKPVSSHSLDHLEMLRDMHHIQPQTVSEIVHANVELEARPPPQDEANPFPERTAIVGVQNVSGRLRPIDEVRQTDFIQLQKDVFRSLSLTVQRNEDNAIMMDQMTKLIKEMRSKLAEFEDRDFRPSLTESSNHDGNMIWKIPRFSERTADAQSGRYTSIFSIPFYTGRYGYKMCLRLYIMGDGVGKNTHMSLFFVIMKGDFDNILQWPFTSKVTFKLINQTGNRDIIDTFQPDPMSSSFQKPKSDMNIASGCPQFASHTELKNGGFIVDDTVFVKCFTID